MGKRITKVTTKTGDDGTTGMADGSRVNKSSTLINAIGEIDELNSWIGLLSALPELSNTKVALVKIQNCLFDIGGSMTMKSQITLNQTHILELEELIVSLNEDLPALKNFVLPGGHESSSQTQIARAVCRRAERAMVKAAEEEPLDLKSLAYVNRLSDFLFVLARKINNDQGEKETLWSQN